MRSIFLLYVMLMATSIALPGCIAQDNEGEASSASAIRPPTEDLPEGFDLIAVIDEETPGINMTSEIEEFLSPEEIGTFDATIGKYRSPEGYDAKVIIINLEDSSKAIAAVENYKSLPELANPPAKGVDRFAPVDLDGHDATEIRDLVRNEAMRYSYIWNDGPTVVLVDGTEDREESLEFAGLVYA